MKHVQNTAEYRNEIMIRLMKGPCYIIFKKKDGSVRHMLCTLHNKLIPQDTVVEHDKGKKYTRMQNDNIISAYDINTKGWRSFIVENVKFFEELTKLDSEKKREMEENLKS